MWVSCIALCCSLREPVKDGHASILDVRYIALSKKMDAKEVRRKEAMQSVVSKPAKLRRNMQRFSKANEIPPSSCWLAFFMQPTMKTLQALAWFRLVAICCNARARHVS